MPNVMAYWARQSALQGILGTRAIREAGVWHRGIDGVRAAEQRHEAGDALVPPPRLARIHVSPRARVKPHAVTARAAMDLDQHLLHADAL